MIFLLWQQYSDSNILEDSISRSRCSGNEIGAGSCGGCDGRMYAGLQRPPPPPMFSPPGRGLASLSLNAVVHARRSSSRRFEYKAPVRPLVLNPSAPFDHACIRRD